MFSGNGSVYYKVSDNTNDEPVWVGNGTIVGQVHGLKMHAADTTPNDSIVVAVYGAHLYWAYDGSDLTNHEIDSSVLGSETEVANVCGIDDTGFYFSSHYTGAKLWFVAHESGSTNFAVPTESPYNMTDVNIGAWQPDTRISWITAVPKIGVQGYDVMFTGDRSYRLEEPVGSGIYHRYSDGRQLWGMLNTDPKPELIRDISSEPAPWYGTAYPPVPPYGQCPSGMVISNNKVAIADGTLYFTTTSNMFSQLWRSNGTLSSTVPIRNEEYLPSQDGDVPFSQTAGMDGYLDAGPDMNLHTSDDVPRVFFWLADAFPTDLWVTDGGTVAAITGFKLDYCAGPKMAGQHNGGRPLAIVTDIRDPLYGTVYFSAGITNYDGQTISSLYKISRLQNTIVDSQDGVPRTWFNAIWDSGIGPNSACRWLTVVETNMGGGVYNHKLYFRGGEPVNTTNMRNRQLLYYDPQASPSPTVYSVDLSGDSVPDMDVSWLVWDELGSPKRLYYFSLYGTQGTNVKLCWWDLNP